VTRGDVAPTYLVRRLLFVDKMDMEITNVNAKLSLSKRNPKVIYCSFYICGFNNDKAQESKQLSSMTDRPF
jgi:hypothetical protein